MNEQASAVDSVKVDKVLFTRYVVKYVSQTASELFLAERNQTSRW